MGQVRVLRIIIHELSNKVCTGFSHRCSTTAVCVDQRLHYRSSAGWDLSRGLMWQGNKSKTWLLSRDRTVKLWRSRAIENTVKAWHVQSCWADSHINTLSTLVHAKTSSPLTQRQRASGRCSLRRSRSLKVTDFGTHRKPECRFPFVNYTNVHPISHRYHCKLLRITGQLQKLVPGN